jgi:hydrophobe/amphiphile efflux-3 (HAE3) family protein
MQRVADFLLRFPRAAMAALVVLSVGAGLYLLLLGVRFDYNLENFLPADDPGIQEFKAFTEAYEPDDAFIVVGFEADDVFAYETLSDIRAMTERLGAIEGVEDVASVTSVENLRGTEAGIEVAPLVGRLIDHPDSLRAVRASVLGDSLAAGYVVNEGGTATALFIRIQPELNSYTTRGAIIDEAKAALAPFGERYEFRWSGYPYLRNAYVTMLQTEVVRSVGLASLVIVLVLVWMFRSVRGVVIPLIVVWLGLLWTIATMMVLGAPIDVLTSTLAAIILVVAVADSVHLIAKYYDGLGQGLGKRAAIRQMAVRLGAATLLTSVTTAIGFGTLATSQVVPMKRFGLFTALGVVVTFAISLVLITVVLQWTKPPKEAQIQRLSMGGFDRLLRWVDGFAERRAKAIIVVSIIVCGLSVLGATQLRVNSYINDDLGPRTQVYQDIRFLEERIVSPFRFETVLMADEPDAFKDPALLRTVNEVESWLQRQPAIQRVVAPTDLLKQLNRAMRGDSASAYRLPETADLAAQYFFLLELTDEAALRRFVDFDYGEVRLSALMNDVGSAEIKAFRARFDDFLAETLPPDIRVKQTGTIVLAAGLADYLVESLLLSIGLAFVFISLLMGFLFRNVRLVFISLVPNVVPLLVIAGLMGVLGIEIKPATAVIFSIAFGIAVDDSIHMLARLRQEMKAGAPLRAAVTATVLGTGKAVLLTSLILFGGFAVLMTSVFQSTTYMGLLVSTTVLLALLADLFLLPALLHVMKPEIAADFATDAAPAETPERIAA